MCPRRARRGWELRGVGGFVIEGGGRERERERERDRERERETTAYEPLREKLWIRSGSRGLEV